MDTEESELDSDLFSKYNIYEYIYILTGIILINLIIVITSKVKCLKEILIFSKLLTRLES